jgi:hypothetical protein
MSNQCQRPEKARRSTSVMKHVERDQAERGSSTLKFLATDPAFYHLV